MEGRGDDKSPPGLGESRREGNQWGERGEWEYGTEVTKYGILKTTEDGDEQREEKLISVRDS